MINLKSRDDVEKMRAAGRLAARTLNKLVKAAKVGVTTASLDKMAHDFIIKHGGVPSPLNYKGFPKSICTSINDVLCHGIPSRSEKLKRGDVINIDVTVTLDGFHGDTSRTVIIGQDAQRAESLVRTTERAMLEAIKMVKPGVTLGAIGQFLHEHARGNGFCLVRDFIGHGIGRGFHEAPAVPDSYVVGQGTVLEAGMTFTIEPIYVDGKSDFKILSDGWTAISRDKSISAQFEHTVLVTQTGVEILTYCDGTPVPEDVRRVVKLANSN